jgi:diguanylate cyclase (GGDEF)-like protein/PAS domain S-box-containing protein
MFGWSADEVVGQLIPIVPPERVDAAVDGLARLVAGETIPVGETVLQHRDGHLLHAIASATVTHTPEGAPGNIVAFAFDITEQHRTREALRDQDIRMRTVLTKISETVTVLGADGTVQYSTGQFSSALGYPNDFWNDLDIFSIIHPDDQEPAEKRFEEVLEAPGTELSDVFRIRDADGRWVPTEVTAVNLLDDAEVRGIVVTTRNLTELRRTKELLADEARILELIATGAPLDETLPTICRMVERHSRGTTGIVVLGHDGRLRVAAGPNVPEGLTAGINGHRPFGLFRIVIDSRTSIVVDDVRTQSSNEALVAGSVAQGAVSGWASPINDIRTDEVMGAICTYFDEPHASATEDLEVSELASHLTAIAFDRSRAHEALEHQAHHDTLTGLPNRTMIMKRLEQMLRQGAASGHDVAVMLLDLDRFKVINDSLGQRAGDALLGMFADRLRGLIRPDDLVGRFSADEFVILLSGDEVEPAVHATANRIEVGLSEPFSLDEGDVFLSASTGVAFSGLDDDTSHRLLEQASAAMVAAKRLGRDRLEVFDQAMRSQARERLQLESDLRVALDQHELVLHYQPKLDLRTDEVVGVEALVRWEHPTRGLILPDEFIPLAEETGLITRVGRWVLEEAVRQAREWVDEIDSLDHFVMAVNFSPRQMGAVDLITNLGRVLLKYQWPPERLSVEVTETILIDDADGSLEVLDQLADLGVRLTIDDFGTGYSSLSYLHRFPVDIVKIDRAFVTELRADGTGSPVAAAIMQMAATLGIITAAEGVETEEQLAGLRVLGCDWAQGFLFSRPVPGDEITALLRSRA